MLSAHAWVHHSRAYCTGQGVAPWANSGCLQLHGPKCAQQRNICHCCLLFGGISPVLQHWHNNTDSKQDQYDCGEHIPTLVCFSLGFVCPVLSFSCSSWRSRILLTCNKYKHMTPRAINCLWWCCFMIYTTHVSCHQCCNKQLMPAV